MSTIEVNSNKGLVTLVKNHIVSFHKSTRHLDAIGNSHDVQHTIIWLEGNFSFVAYIPYEEFKELYNNTKD